MNDFNENAKEIKDKANSLYNTAKKNASKAYSQTKPKADELASQLGDTAFDLYKTGKDKLYQAEDYIEDSLADMSRSIQKKPLTSVLLAAGIGYLFAKLVK